MSLRKLPEVKAFERPAGIQWDPPSDALARWANLPQAAEADDGATISIYDVIGEDWWTGGGFTSKRCAAALRAIGKRDVTVNINSPGGDMFEGLAIYNLLREHPAKVTVKVMGLAASAASVIAMSGDHIEMGLGTFMMIHNAWGVVIGNRHDMRSIADIFDEFDAAMAEIYEARTTQPAADIAELMDNETWIRAKQAVEKGFADDIFDGPDETTDNASAQGTIPARRRVDCLLAQQGVPRSERRRLFRDIVGTQDAADPVTPGADVDPAALKRLIETIRS